MVRELREILTFTGLLKNVIKDTDKQPDEDIHRMRSGSVLSPGASVPVELECVTLPCVDVFTFLETLQTQYYGDLYEGFTQRRHDPSLVPFSALPTFQEYRGMLKILSF